MARHTTSDEQKLKAVLQRLPFADEDKSRWIETLDDSGLNEDLAKEIQNQVAELPRAEEEDVAMRRGRDAVEVSTIIRRWRLNQNLPGNRRR